MNKVVVIGASGFLGRRICHAFKENGSMVWGVYNSNVASLPEFCHPCHIDDLEKLSRDFDCVVIAAGNYSLDPKQLIDVNVMLTKRTVNHFSASKLIFVSSTSVYGNHAGKINEFSSFNSPSFYGLSKLAGEAVALSSDRYAILRLSYLYGVDMPKNSFLPKVLDAARSNRKITLYGDGSRQQDYLHVDDAAHMCLLASQSLGNNIYLGATGVSISNLQIGRAIKELLPDCSIGFTGKDTASSFIFNVDGTCEKLTWSARRSVLEDLQELL